MFEFISSNTRITQSYDFGTCLMMKKVDDKSTYGMNKCYVCSLLNGYRSKALRSRFKVKIDNQLHLILRKMTLANAIVDVSENLLMGGFSFPDYIKKKKDKLFLLVRGIKYRHIVISKTF